MNRIFSSFFCLLIWYSGFSQSITTSGSLYLRIEGIIDNMPAADGDDYISPSGAELALWEELVEQLLVRDITSATSLALQLNYDLVAFTDTSSNVVYHILESQGINGNYWGTYVLNMNACQTNVIIQSPHPKHDMNTGLQGIHVFESVGASFFMLSGTHRCNSPMFSVCSGTTSVCNPAGESFRVTDMAHVTESIFQVTHELFYEMLPDPYVFQLHGFSWSPTSGLPHLILSNTVSSAPQGEDVLVGLGDQLVHIDPSLTYGVKHVDTSLPLSGSTNTQGRYINGSVDPCSSSGNINSGRFMHIEQSKVKLRQSESDWEKMALAIDRLIRNITIESLSSSVGRYKAKDSLNVSASIMAGGVADMVGGECVLLQPSFEVATGGECLITIDTCSSN